MGYFAQMKVNTTACDCQDFDRAVGVIMCENHCTAEHAVDTIIETAHHHHVPVEDVTSAILNLVDESEPRQKAAAAPGPS